MAPCRKRTTSDATLRSRKKGRDTIAAATSPRIKSGTVASEHDATSNALWTRDSEFCRLASLLNLLDDSKGERTITR